MVDAYSNLSRGTFYTQMREKLELLSRSWATMSIETYEPDKHDRDAIYCVKVGVNDHNHKFVFLTRRQTTTPPPYIPVDGEKVYHFLLKLDRSKNHL